MSLLDRRSLTNVRLLVCLLAHPTGTYSATRATVILCPRCDADRSLRMNAFMHDSVGPPITKVEDALVVDFNKLSFSSASVPDNSSDPIHAILFSLHTFHVSSCIHELPEQRCERTSAAEWQQENKIRLKDVDLKSLPSDVLKSVVNFHRVQALHSKHAAHVYSDQAACSNKLSNRALRVLLARDAISDDDTDVIKQMVEARAPSLGSVLSDAIPLKLAADAVPNPTGPEVSNALLNESANVPAGASEAAAGDVVMTFAVAPDVTGYHSA